MVTVKKWLTRSFVSLFALIWLVISLLPFYLMIITSLKSTSDYSMNGYFSLPKKFLFANYAKVIKSGIFTYFKNSLVVVVLSLVILLFISLCASYPFSRMKVWFGKPLFSFFIACMTIPIHVTLIPIYLLTRQAGLYDSVFALIGPYIAFNLPITVFILTSFMRGIPKELEEAAVIDGCNRLRMFFTIIIPLSLPGIVTVAIYDAIAMWNEFSFALVLTQSPQTRTLPLSLWIFKGQYSTDVPMLFCVLVISALPMIIAFAFGQEKLVKGMMAGAVKG